MFCPQCGSQQSDELKFCKSCGANLHAVRQAVATRETGAKFDWGKTWVAEMLMSSEEAVRRQAELERLQGITPEVKRYNEIKAGVITSSAGLGLTVVIYVLMQGIILSGAATPEAAEILSRLWVAGAIPILVGIALIINGLFVSKKLVEISRQARREANLLGTGAEPLSLRSADTNEFIPSGLSVTEETTRHLRSSGQKPQTPTTPER